MSGSLLEKGLSALGFCGDSAAALRDKMESYIKELMLFNAAYDLVGTDDRDGIIVRHILDSLSAAHVIRQLVEKSHDETGSAARIGDIGSGGGLPGIPLAAAMPDARFTLVERMSKRCAFLENCAAILGLGNVGVRNTQAEQMPPEQLDVAVFRAFRPLDRKMTQTLLRLVRPGGTLAAYKAKSASIAAEMQAVSDLTGGYKKIPLAVPFLDGHERHLVIVRRS